MDKPLVGLYKSLLIPTLIGIASLLGICLIVALERPRPPDSQTIQTQTITPFKYLLLATETPNPTPRLDIVAGREVVSTPIVIVQAGRTLLPLLTEQIPLRTEPSSTSVRDVFAPTAARPSNPIFDTTTPMEIGTYDDSDPHIARAGDWIDETNVDSVYQGTLLISENAGNYVAFHFVGILVVLGYHSSLESGDVTINIDGLEYTQAQTEGFEWISPELPPGPHYVIITHERGTSVNMDYIDIPN